MTKIENMATLGQTDADTHTILIAEEITKDLAERFLTEVHNVVAQGVKKIVVKLTSLGGDVVAGYMMADTLIGLTGKVETEVIGVGPVASSATYIAMVADKFVMTAHATFLIHRATGGCYTDNNIEELYEMVDYLSRLEQQIVALYGAKTGISPDDIMSLMNAGKYMSAKQTKELGFCDEVIGVAKKDEVVYDLATLLSNNAEKEAEKPAKLDDEKKQNILSMANLIEVCKSVISRRDIEDPAELSNKAELENKIAEQTAIINDLENKLRMANDKLVANDTLLKGQIEKLEAEKAEITNRINTTVINKLSEMGVDESTLPAPRLQNDYHKTEQVDIVAIAKERGLAYALNM